MIKDYTTDPIIKGQLLRLVAITIIINLPITNCVKAILIFLTDFIDCWTAKLLVFFSKDDKNISSRCKSFKYQLLDKVNDLFSYCIVYFYLGLSPFYLLLIAIRFVGILMFYKTLDSSWLIKFPDLFKEILLYELFVSKLNVTNVSIIVILKIIFEYIWHNYTNNNNYYKTESAEKLMAIS